MTAAMPHERRLTPRTAAAIVVEPLSGGPRLVAQDLGVGGMLVTTKSPRWPGALVRVRFRLPGEPRAIRATCRVVELVEVPHGVGLSLRFLRLAPEAAAAIARHVARHTDRRELPAYEHLAVAQRLRAWVERLLDDCRQLAMHARA